MMKTEDHLGDTEIGELRHYLKYYASCKKSAFSLFTNHFFGQFLQIRSPSFSESCNIIQDEIQVKKTEDVLNADDQGESTTALNPNFQKQFLNQFRRDSGSYDRRKQYYGSYDKKKQDSGGIPTKKQDQRNTG